MTNSVPEGRARRRTLVASALAAAVVLAGAAFVIARAPGARPIAARAPEPVVRTAPSPVADAWAALTPVEQGTLQPLKTQWASLAPAARTHWIQVADRLRGRPSRAVARAAQHMLAWQSLSPAERAQARVHYRLASRLSPAERERRWETYQAWLRAAPQPHDGSRPVLTAASPAPPAFARSPATPLVTQLPSDTPTTLRVRDAAGDAPASAPATGSARHEL